VATRTIRFSEPWRDPVTTHQYAVNDVATLASDVARSLITAGWAVDSAAPVTPVPDPLPQYALDTDLTAALATRAPVSTTWQPATPYKAGQLVWQNGNIYRAKVDFTSTGSFNTANWDLAFTAAYVTRSTLGNRLGVTGDSITAANTDTAANSIADSWSTHLCLASGGSVQHVVNGGHGGFTSTQLLALLQTEVLALGPTLVGICWGTNDTLDGSNQPTTTAANDKAAVAAIRSAGAQPFLCTIPPQGMAALPAPAAPVPSAVASGGTLAAATYRYKVTAVNGVGETTASAVGSVVVASGTTNSVNVDLTHMEGAGSYKVYKETSDGSGVYGLVATLSSSGGQSLASKRWTDVGGATPAAAPPGSNTTAIAYSATAQRKIKAINAWRRRYASATGIPLVDFHGLLVDPATGLYQTGWTGDGTHPTTARQKYMGQLAWNTIKGEVSTVLPPLTQDNADPINLYSNGCFINGSASLPTSYASYGGSAAGFTDTLAAKTGFAGKALIAERTVPDVRFHDSPTISTGFSAGDRILLAFVLPDRELEAGGGLVSVSLGTSGASVGCNLILSAVDIAPSVWLTSSPSRRD
jgi:lysophospholipase L1-like esterase